MWRYIVVEPLWRYLPSRNEHVHVVQQSLYCYYYYYYYHHYYYYLITQAQPYQAWTNLLVPKPFTQPRDLSRQLIQARKMLKRQSYRMSSSSTVLESIQIMQHYLIVHNWVLIPLFDGPVIETDLIQCHSPIMPLSYQVQNAELWIQARWTVFQYSTIHWFSYPGIV